MDDICITDFRKTYLTIFKKIYHSLSLIMKMNLSKDFCIFRRIAPTPAPPVPPYRGVQGCGWFHMRATRAYARYS